MRENLIKVSRVLLVIGIISIIVGVSYSTITGIKYIGLNENKINNCKIDVSFKEGKGISLTNTYPMDYVDAKNYSPYTFYIKNNSSSCDNLKYKITMENTCSGDIIDDKFISYELVNVDTGEVIRGDGINTLNDTFKIRSGSTNSYEMRIWINEKAKSADLYVNGDPNKSKKYCGKLSAEIIATNNLDKTGANEPVLSSNMIPVYYDETNDTWKKADVNNENKNYKWYDYNEGMWANAVTVTETNRETYQKAVLGTPISMDDITTMLVWIPRFEYRYDNLGDNYAGGTRQYPGEIEVKFILKSQIIASKENYIIHPAFTFGNQNLSGIWVGKFEISHDTLSSSTADNTLNCNTTNCSTADGLRILPNKVSLRKNTISHFFFAIKSMQREGNPYGFTDEVDVHMIKISDWGAIAYLSQSKYGKYGNNKYTKEYKEIYTNRDSNYITGKSSGAIAKITSNELCDYNDVEDRENGSGSCGGGASTTGNIYGVYDMVGGAWDYLMACFSITGTSVDSRLSGFKDEALINFNRINENDKYVTYFPASVFDEDYRTNMNKCNFELCGGYALYETNRWYNNTNNFVDETHSWFGGGGADKGASIGIFDLDFYYSGMATSKTTTRVVVATN